MPGISISGGDKWKKALEKYAKEPELRVGILDGATYQGEYGTKAGQSVAEVAYWQEYGTHNKEGGEIIPPRPFFRNSIEEKKSAWLELVENEVKRGQSLDDAFFALGETATADITETIKAGVNPPLSDITLERRQLLGLTSTTPLMQTMTLIKALGYEVDK